MKTDELLTAKELAAILKVSVQTVYRLAREKKIKSVKVGGSIRFSHTVVPR